MKREAAVSSRVGIRCGLIMSNRHGLGWVCVVAAPRERGIQDSLQSVVESSNDGDLIADHADGLYGQQDQCRHGDPSPACFGDFEAAIFEWIAANPFQCLRFRLHELADL